jgi:uncharacterized protein (DUF1810 family)
MAEQQDPFNLRRFVVAQDAGGTYQQALAELRRGRKTTHWMWFIFPQLRGLGSSQMSRMYAISGVDEAKAYLAHPVLGPRLVECARAVVDASARTPEEIFGGIDTQKLRSSMTLFRQADPSQPVFQQVLDRYFNGQPDPASEVRARGPLP